VSFDDLKRQIIEILEAEYDGWKLPWFKRMGCVADVSKLLEISSVTNRDEAEKLREKLSIHIKAAQFDMPVEIELCEKISDLIDNFMRPLPPPLLDFSIDVSQQAEPISLFFEYEHAFLDLLREYSDEMKFVMLFKQQLRKERGTFFNDAIRNMLEEPNDYDVIEGLHRWLLTTCVNEHSESVKNVGLLVECSLLKRLTEIRKEAKRRVKLEYKEV